MGQNRLTEFIFANHAEAVRGEKNMYQEQEAPGYPMITKKGETQTREKTQMLVGVINKMPAGSVLVLGGVSNAARTKSTMAVYASELWKLLSITRQDAFFVEPLKGNSVEYAFAAIAEFCNVRETRGLKIVIIFPFQIAEFISMPGQKENEIVRGILAGLNREESFFRRFFPEKQITFFHVGHSIETDALIAFLNRENNRYKGKARFSFM